VVPTVVKVLIVVFWVVMLCGIVGDFNLEDGGPTFLQNICNQLQDITAQKTTIYRLFLTFLLVQLEMRILLQPETQNLQLMRRNLPYFDTQFFCELNM
jgi:hypothetical protein